MRATETFPSCGRTRNIDSGELPAKRTVALRVSNAGTLGTLRLIP